MQVRLRNIQSIQCADYVFPETGVVQIAGANSNGKSILIKAVSAVATLKILDQDERDAIIRDGCQEGSIIMEYKGKVLVVTLNRERNLCMVGLQRVDGTQIKRTFRDKGIPELLHEFGFRCYNDNTICLQVYETFGQIPFVTTSTKVNAEIVKAITEDSVARTFLNNYKEITYKGMREQMKAYNDAIANKQRLKDTIVVFNHMKYQNFYDIMKEKYNVLKYLDYIELDYINPPACELEVIDVPNMDFDEIPIPPEVNIINLSVPKLGYLQYKDAVEVPGDVDDMLQEVEHLDSILEGRCPTCGKLLFEEHAC